MAHSSDDRPDVAGILADRLAATLVHHEPGWRLPRPSALARRYNVRPSQVEEAVKELAARHLIRQLSDGQLYRASPVEYLIPVQGIPQLGAHLDPMGSEVTCRSRKVSWRRVPEDIGWALGAHPSDPICAVKCLWAVNGEPAAISTTYLTKETARQISESSDVIADAVGDLALSSAMESARPDGPVQAVGAVSGRSAVLGVPAALHLEMQPPPSSVARGLRLSSGQPAAMVTVRYDDPPSGQPVALTVAALRADLFRIVVESPADASPIRGVRLGDALDDDPAMATEALAADGVRHDHGPTERAAEGLHVTALPSLTPNSGTAPSNPASQLP